MSVRIFDDVCRREILQAFEFSTIYTRQSGSEGRKNSLAGTSRDLEAI